MNKTRLANSLLIFVAAAVLGLFYLFVKVNTPYQSELGTGQAPPPPSPSPLARPILSSADPNLGPPNAAYTIVNFSDFRCPYCAGVARDLRALQKKFPAKVRLIWKDFPFLPPSEASQKLHEAARCAAQQNKFWEYHDWLFDSQNSINITDEQLTDEAKTLALDADKFRDCLLGGQMTALVRSNFEEGRRLGIDGTPYLFLNGEKAESVVDLTSKIK